MISKMQIEGFYDPATSTVSYLLIDTGTRQCAIIDSVLDYDPDSGRTRKDSADKLISRIRELDTKVEWILETHVHADHLTAAPYLKDEVGGKTAIGANIAIVQTVFGDLFNVEPGFARDGSQFDQLFVDGQEFSIGGLHGTAMHTPGHTPACMTYVVTDGTETIAFVGDTLFMPDYGTARCDFPGGNAATLYQSIQKVLALPPETRLYMCHDYPPGGRDVAFVTTVAEQLAGNIHVHQGVTEQDFVAMRTERDATLALPKLILPSVQVNMRAGAFPEPEQNGTRYIKIPIDTV
ncbi:MAG: MBL fold metallo-hydrolase [Burkholderiaceae bacterium]